MGNLQEFVLNVGAYPCGHPKHDSQGRPQGYAPTGIDEMVNLATPTAQVKSWPVPH
jgi:hypothetical protein